MIPFQALFRVYRLTVRTPLVTLPAWTSISLSLGNPRVASVVQLRGSGQAKRVPAFAHYVEPVLLDGGLVPELFS